MTTSYNFLGAFNTRGKCAQFPAKLRHYTGQCAIITCIIAALHVVPTASQFQHAVSMSQLVKQYAFITHLPIGGTRVFPTAFFPFN